MAIENTQKIIKHKGTYSPLKCEHCSLMWYGYYTSDAWLDNVVLCARCYNALINHVYKYGNYDERRENPSEYQKIVREWAANKKNKPHPRTPERSFHSSVPKWMRNAINAGMVTANDTIWYIVYSQGDQTIKVETMDKSPRK